MGGSKPPIIILFLLEEMIDLFYLIGIKPLI